MFLKDPSVQRAVNSKPQANLDEYNPYGGTQQSGPAVMPSTNPDPPPPTYTPSNQQQVSSKDFEVISHLKKFLFQLKKNRKKIRKTVFTYKLQRADILSF